MCVQIRGHVFLADGFGSGAASRDHPQQNMTSAAFTKAQVGDVISLGEIKDAPTIAALGLLFICGSRSQQCRFRKTFRGDGRQRACHPMLASGVRHRIVPHPVSLRVPLKLNGCYESLYNPVVYLQS